MVFWIFFSFLILLRLAELIVSRRNEQWLLAHGAVEYGKEHYPFMIALHASFFVSLVIEYIWRGTAHYSPVLMVLFVILILFKAWVISSLGTYWNTKIYRAPDFPLIDKGPYQYFKHPNYMIVIAEIAIIPLAFHLYCTAIVFSALNALMLMVRIREENKALRLNNQ